jgi:hypothetical protein
MRCNLHSFFLRAVFSLIFLVAPSSAHTQSLANPSSSQTVPSLDESNLQHLTGNPGLRARGAIDQGRVPDALPLNHILLLLQRNAAREQELDQFIAQQYDPHSASFHQWLTPQQFGERFGPSSADVEKVTQWLAQQGFKLNRVPAGDLFVDFSGDAGKIAQAFHTEIHHYRVNGEDHYANASEPSIPAALSPWVSGFRSLDDFHPRSHVHRPGVAHFDREAGRWSRAKGDAAHLTQTPGTVPLYIAGPQDFATIYGINEVWKQHAGAASSTPLLIGTGQTIGVVGESDPQSADIQTFRDQFGITALGPNGSVQLENPPSSVCAAPDPADNEPESYLDAEWAGATAPDATVDFVACGRQGLTSGADLAAAYIIADPAHVQKISVLSTSYGDCEALPQSEANHFYVSLWQQAAAEGITVVVAASDTGGDGCQSVNTYATDGLSVVNEASTPYNIAVGGTDFSDVFSGTTSTYWSPVNGANFQSALSYIPEMAWNDSCASPLVLATFGQNFQSSFGANGFCTDAAQQPVDPNLGFPPYFLPFAGSGGLSVVSARPGWQTGVTGIPAQGGRAVPDISMFASGGNTWSQALILCDSGLANMPAGTACDFANASDIFANYDGGSSFVAPAFAGIMALIDQKSNSRQGQANYVLYPLAAQQYVSNSNPAQPSLATCAAYLGPQALSSCYFHDISATPNPASASAPFLTGNTAVPCTGTATSAGTFTDSSTDPSSHNQDCYGYQITVTQNGASLTTTPNYYGVLSTAENDNAPAFPAGPGYDLATGLGSPNVPALVNAPEWSALSIAPATLPGGRVGSAYTQTLTATGRIAPYTWSVVSGSLPPGLSLAASTGVISGTPAAAGPFTFAIQVADSESPPVTAMASFSLTVAAAPMASATTLTSSALTAGTGMSVTFAATVSGQGGVPTGTVTFFNGSTSIGTSTLTEGVATFTTSFPTAGTVTLHASYAGDANFTASTSGTLMETIVVPGFTIAVNPSSLTIPFANSGVVSVTLTPQGGFTGSVSFSCGTLPAYFSCSFAEPSAAFSATGSALTNNLTIHSAVSPAASAAVSGGASGGVIAVAAFWLAPFFAGLLTTVRRKRGVEFANRLWRLCFLCLLFAGIAAMSACGRGDHEAPDGTYNVPIIVTSPGLTTQTVNVTVMVQ